MSESKLTAALIQFHKDVDKIEKNARANYGRFADLANVLSTVTPALLKNNLVITQEFLTDSLITTLRHVSGEHINSTCDLVLSEGRNKTQEWGKAVTYQRRYAIVSLLGLVADMDMDGAMLEDEPKPAEPAPKKTVKKKAAPAPTPAPTPEPTPAPPAEQPLSKDEYDLVIDLLKKVHRDTPDKLQSLTASFRKKFTDLSGLTLSQVITTQAHVAFINDQL